MRKITKKLSAMALCTVFASMQIAIAAPIDTGLGAANGGAVINDATGGFQGVDKTDNSATLKFNGDSHVKWDTLNVDKDQKLNFNAIDGAKGLTVVNTVNNGMTNIYGTVTSNAGISKLIISNPNGMLFDGAKFTTAGDLMLTTQNLTVKMVDDKIVAVDPISEKIVNGIEIRNSDFSIGGEFNVTAPSVVAINSYIKAGKGLRLVTADGQNFEIVEDKYQAEGSKGKYEYATSVRLEAVSVDGNVYIVADRNLVNIVDGGTIKGNLTVESDGNVALNYTNHGNVFNVTGDVNVNNDGRISYLKNSTVGGNVTMANSGGFLEINNVNVDGDVNLTTTVKTNTDVKHFVHVVGDNDIKGNLNVDSIHNIHIGGYNKELTELQPGSLKVGGEINAVAHEGSVSVIVDTVADKISLESGTLNIISDGKATMTANEYSFNANKYIGAIDSNSVLIDVMEHYIPLGVNKDDVLIDMNTPKLLGSYAGYLNIAGGDVTNLTTGNGGYAYLRADGDMNLTGVNTHLAKISAGKDIVIGDNVHADRIVVDGETERLTVNLPSRDYNLEYTNIKDTEVIKIDPNTEITYEMANGEEGWNKGTQTKDNTYLVVPGPDDPTPPEPVDPDDPTPPGPVNPDDPTPGPNPDDNENVKVLNNYQRDLLSTGIDADQGYTPVAFAADLDDEIETGVRKNVDGSVTVVRPFTPVE